MIFLSSFLFYLIFFVFFSFSCKKIIIVSIFLCLQEFIIFPTFFTEDSSKTNGRASTFSFLQEYNCIHVLLLERENEGKKQTPLQLFLPLRSLYCEKKNFRGVKMKLFSACFTPLWTFFKHNFSTCFVEYKCFKFNQSNRLLYQFRFK